MTILISYFFFNFSKEKKLDFINCHSVLFPAFAPRFPAFPPPFPVFPSFRSPIPHSGFYRYPKRSNIFMQYPLNNIRVSDVYFKWIEQATINIRSSHWKLFFKIIFSFCKEVIYSSFQWFWFQFTEWYFLKVNLTAHLFFNKASGSTYF